MENPAMDDLPLALRRTRRASTIRPTPPTDASSPAARTPKRRARRVRFSDPGPIIRGGQASCSSTGLTPIVRRASLGAPTRRNRAEEENIDVGVRHEELVFAPLRQVLSGRVQRRLRRNGLSEEMNSIEGERRRRARDDRAEAEALRARLAEKDLEIYRLQNETVVVDTQRVWDLERQVVDLRAELGRTTSSSPSAALAGYGDVTMREARDFEWTTAARDPFADDYDTVADADEFFGDETVAELQCGTPRRAVVARASFPSPPLTSPMDPRHYASSPPASRTVEAPRSAHVGVQTSFSFRDEEKDALEEEVASLQLEMGKMGSTLEGYAALVAGIAEKVGPYVVGDEMTGGDDVIARDGEEGPHARAAEVQGGIDGLLRALADRTAALLDLTSSLSGLGFPGDDAPSIVASLASGFRAARLELEYLSPGESTLPLASRGAAVLDALLGRLRELGKRAREDEDAIDEYHALETSLRKQLAGRVAVMDDLRAELAAAQGMADERGRRVGELEVGVSRLRGAVDGYVRDMGELEGLVERLEAEGKEKDGSIALRDGRILELETGLGEAVAREGDLRAQMAGMESRLAEGVSLTERLTAEVSALEASRSAMSRQHGKELAIRDARVEELRSEIDRLGASLRGAHATIQALGVEKQGLKRRVVEGRERARGMIDGVKGELQRVLRMSEEFLEETEREVAGPDSEEKPANRAKVGGLLSGGLARRTSRKRPDSGLGLLEEDEIEC